ncbi:MAG TPA: NUDIX domain-containing protein, partial [Chryseolinea sp.]|nr:NUDIX domain-containing protein [Chryseolinea sp.]
MTRKVSTTLQSAGLLMCRKNPDALQFFLIHPGGPFWKNKNEGAWSIPKGLVEENESMLETAQREFLEETGIKPVPPFHSLDTVRTKSGKILHAWTFLGSWEPADGFTSNNISIELPPRSKKYIMIPEADKG